MLCNLKFLEWNAAISIHYRKKHIFHESMLWDTNHWFLAYCMIDWLIDWLMDGWMDVWGMGDGWSVGWGDGMIVIPFDSCCIVAFDLFLTIYKMSGIGGLEWYFKQCRDCVVAYMAYSDVFRYIFHFDSNLGQNNETIVRVSQRKLCRKTFEVCLYGTAKSLWYQE